MERDESIANLARRFWIALEMPGWDCAAQVGGWGKIGVLDRFLQTDLWYCVVRCVVLAFAWGKMLVMCVVAWVRFVP